MINILAIFSGFAALADGRCQNSFLGFPTWFKYLKTEPGQFNQCVPSIEGINDLWFIGLAAIEILTRVAALVAIAFILYGGIKYSASRGNSDKVENAKNTLVDAIAGLIIAIVATATVSFIAGRFTQ